MSTCLVLDTLGKRYGMLPSQVLQSATTIDMTVMDVALSWEVHRQSISEGKQQYDVDQLRNMIDQNAKRTAGIRSSGG